MEFILTLVKNKYVQAVLVFVAIVGGHTAYVYLTYEEVVPAVTPEVTTEEDSTTPATPETTDVLEEMNDMSNTTGVDTEPESGIDYTGTHIMKDSSVMTGSGLVIEDATILPDSTIELNDGTILTPLFDLREKESEPISMAEPPSEVIIDIVGINFAYDVTEIRVKKDDIVTINFTSGGGFHDWAIDIFNASTDRVDTGGKTSVTFVADTVGTFQYYCSVGSHREKGQVGTLTVE